MSPLDERTERDRVDHERVVAMIEALVGTENRACLNDVVDTLEWCRLEAGEVLFEEAAPADAAYFIVTGRLIATRLQPDGSMLRLAEMGNGELVGERGLIDGTPRAATIRAVRDTTLARFTGVAFESLLSRHAALALHVTRQVVRRSERPIARPRAASIAVAITAAIDADAFLVTLVEELSRGASTTHLNAARVDSLLGSEGAAQTTDHQVADALHRIDADHDRVVFETDREPERPPLSPWSRRCLRHADRVVLVLSDHPDRNEDDHLCAYVRELRALASIPWWLVVVHGESDTRVTNSAALLQRYGGEEIVHVRVGRNDDVARLARLLTGHGVGLVLSGGGARGFAHLGVHRAMRELGVPIDVVGGASIGAPIGAGIALALEPDELDETIRRQFHRLLDYTVPVVSILKGARISRRIEESLGGVDIEDLWLGFYCVSTNLSAARLEVHRRGPLARSVRASVAIPGVLPPVVVAGDLLVDGGVLSNLPVSPMRSHPGIGTVITVDVAADERRVEATDFGSSVSGWRALSGVAGSSLRRTRSAYPTLGNVLVRTMLVGSRREQNTSGDSGPNDLAIEIRLDDVNLLAFGRVEPVARAGYVAARPIVERWLAGDAGARTRTFLP